MQEVPGRNTVVFASWQPRYYRTGERWQLAVLPALRPPGSDSMQARSTQSGRATFRCNPQCHGRIVPPPSSLLTIRTCTAGQHPNPVGVQRADRTDWSTHLLPHWDAPAQVTAPISRNAGEGSGGKGIQVIPKP